MTSSASVNDGNWHQLVGVYQAGGSERIYVDGALAATGASEPVVLNNAPFLIGGSVSMVLPPGDSPDWWTRCRYTIGR
ncbi:MAG: LamG domain-containing protein [Verrucomicrobia bacterium]|nr:LamG domain-containing protein [Verrucomicrobiota bacterium]